MKRHQVLFNLYAFDGVRSNRTHTPTLNLINCDFKYFHDKQALIQVETNNFVEQSIVTTDGSSLTPISQHYFYRNYESSSEADISSRYMMHVGEDRGARIHIEGSTFKHSKFCKGMISYREIQDISYQEEKTLMKLRDLVTR